MYFFQFKCLTDEDVGAGLGMAPNTRTIGYKSSDPTVAFIAYAAILNHYLSVVSFPGPDPIISNAGIAGTW